MKPTPEEIAHEEALARVYSTDFYHPERRILEAIKVINRLRADLATLRDAQPRTWSAGDIGSAPGQYSRQSPKGP